MQHFRRDGRVHVADAQRLPGNAGTLRVVHDDDEDGEDDESEGHGGSDDLRAAARILKGRKVSPAVRVYVVPGSQQVRAQAEGEGFVG